MAGQSDFSESSDYVYIEQLDGSKEKKDKKKGKTGPETSEDVPQEEPVEAVEPGAVNLLRGLMVMAYDSDNLDQGFPFPKVLFDFGLLQNDWLHFVKAIAQPLSVWSNKERGHAYEADAICDIVSEWDGLLMGIDMPGEQNYGLDFMDLYYEGTGNRKTFNVSHGIAGTLHKDKMKTSKSNDLALVREKGFESTRIVMDPISVQNDKKLYEQRGWARWDKASAHAKKARAIKIELPVNNESFKPYSPPEASFLNLDPSDPGFQMNSPQVDRWPTSKHFYYDRFRAQRIQFTVRNGDYNWVTHAFWIPASDSMDQRAQGAHSATSL